LPDSAPLLRRPIGLLLAPFLLASRLWLLFPGLGMLLLFRGLGTPVGLLSVRGNNCSEKQEHESRAEKVEWFHEASLHCVELRIFP